MTDNKIRIGVVGGGAAGLFFAFRAGSLGADVTIFEKNEKCGRKLRITGKGRCNLTNFCDGNEFIANIVSNKKFMYSASSALPAEKLMSIFENELHVPLKIERGNRVFPQSDRAEDIVSSLIDGCASVGVKTIRARVTDIITEGGKARGVRCGNDLYRFDRIVLATGGASYPLTGSDGSGYRLAGKLGLKVTDISPSLVPLVSYDRSVGALMGLSLKNIAISVSDNETGREIYRDFGEMLFTHFGFSGPVILSASAHMNNTKKGKYTLSVDLKPALDERKLDSRILSDFSKYRNRDFANSLGDLLPSKMIPYFVTRCGIAGDKKVNSITKEERAAIIRNLKCLSFVIDGTRPIAEAVVTRGGIDVSCIDPRTMECRNIQDLYVIGELLDVDAYTGGFNLHIAFSTANLAATAASEHISR